MLSDLDLSLIYKIILEEPGRALVLVARIIAMDDEWVRIQELESSKIRIIRKNKILSVFEEKSR